MLYSQQTVSLASATGLWSGILVPLVVLGILSMLFLFQAGSWLWEWFRSWWKRCTPLRLWFHATSLSAPEGAYLKSWLGLCCQTSMWEWSGMFATGDFISQFVHLFLTSVYQRYPQAACDLIWLETCNREHRSESICRPILQRVPLFQFANILFQHLWELGWHRRRLILCLSCQLGPKWLQGRLGWRQLRVWFRTSRQSTP